MAVFDRQERLPHHRTSQPENYQYQPVAMKIYKILLQLFNVDFTDGCRLPYFVGVPSHPNVPWLNGRNEKS
jgi:hypothetical protein